MEKTIICSDNSMPCPRTKEKWRAYEEAKRNSEKVCINEDGELLIKCTEYA